MIDIADLIPSVRQGVLHRTGWTLAARCPRYDRAEIGPAREVDLRSPQERSGTCGISIFGIDIPDVVALLGDRPGVAEYVRMYFAILKAAGAQVAAVANTLAYPGTRVIVGCSLGKDRTGVVVALLLRAAGIPIADILTADAAAITKTVGCVRAVRAYAQERGVDPVELVRRCRVGSEPLRAALESLEQLSGGVHSYLISHGANPAALEELRARLLY